MGVGIPGALAAKLCQPERDVVAVVGDAGFMMTSAELETAKRAGANFVTVIFNDSGLGLIKVKMDRCFGRDYGCDFGNPDFAEVRPVVRRQGIPGGKGGRTQGDAPVVPPVQGIGGDRAKVDYSGNDELFRPFSAEGQGRREP